MGNVGDELHTSVYMYLIYNATIIRQAAQNENTPSFTNSTQDLNIISCD